MAYYSNKLFVSTKWEIDSNKLIHTNELIRLLSSHSIRFEIHSSVIKIFDATFMQPITDFPENPNHYQVLSDAIKNCIDILTLDLSECVNIPNCIENFPFLHTIIFPDYLQFIPRVKNCPSIKNITIPKHGVESIDTRNFENYPPIIELKFDGSLLNIDSHAFSSAIIEKIDFSLCDNLESKNIKVFAFSDSIIKEIIFPEQVTILPHGAFSNCKSLRTITGSGLFATFSDASNKCFVKLDCDAHSCEFCFEKCESLQFIQFSPELSVEGIQQLLCHKGFSEDDSSKTGSFYFDERCGIVLGTDDYYSYIWCITDFNYYVSKKLDDSFLNKIVSFYKSNDRYIEMESGNCRIFTNCNDFIALGVSLGCNYHFNNRFNIQGNRLGAVTIDNNQSDALRLYEKQIQLKDIDIWEKVHELETMVDNLDIDSIINSYHSTIHSEHDYRHDEERISMNRFASYTDSYIETLLPSQYCYSEGGYSDSNLGLEDYLLSEKGTEAYEENKRSAARNRYNKEEHKHKIINDFFLEMNANEKFVEHYLRINEARRLFHSYGLVNRNRKRLYGNQLVMALNAMINELSFLNNMSYYC